MIKRIVLIATFLLVVVQTPAHARDKLLDIQEITSPGGIKAWLVEDHSVPVIALQFAFRGAGAIGDPADKQGLARMASNTMDEGAGSLDSQAFQKELTDLALTLHFTSDRDNFGGVLKTLSANKARAFELLQLALSQPRFDADPLARMRAANQSRIRDSLAEPEWIAARILNDKAYQGHPYAQNSGGTLTTLEAITPDDLKGFVKDRLARGDLIVAVAGDITAKELGDILDRLFGHFPEGSRRGDYQQAPITNQGKLFAFEKDIPQTVIEIVQPGISHKDPYYHTAEVMNHILGSAGFGSRLMEEIREKRGLTYGVYSSLDELDKSAVLTVSTSTINEKVPEMLDLIGKEWDRMKSGPVSAQELQSAQSYLTGSLPLSLTSTDAIAELLLSLQAQELPRDYLDIRDSQIKAVTAEKIQALARKLLDRKKMLTVLVGQPKDIPSMTMVTELPNTH